MQTVIINYCKNVKCQIQMIDDQDNHAITKADRIPNTNG